MSRRLINCKNSLQILIGTILIVMLEQPGQIHFLGYPTELEREDKANTSFKVLDNETKVYQNIKKQSVGLELM